MSNIVICAENIGKAYMVGHNVTANQRYHSFRDTLANSARDLARKTRDMLTGRVVVQGDEVEEFWALNNINFEVRQGERVGIIGRNGAGKSTLLKLLSRITEPTTGRIAINGRVASLLEVGTGFHPELSGRENIYLNGAILGMGRGEVSRKFDEIVSFSGVEKFLDTPVKRYSSGMYTRLAFSVAAHLDPEILIVDEVLAVGDAEFQKKCLGKMEDISAGGRTVIFVSHSMQTITSLCNRCILLENGTIKCDGSPSEAVLGYFGGGASTGRVDFQSMAKRIGDDHVQLLYGEVVNSERMPSIEVDIRKPAYIRMGFRVLRHSPFRFVPNFHFVTPGGVYAFLSVPESFSELAPGDYEAMCMLPGDFLNEGAYSVGMAISSFEQGVKVHFFEQGALTFNVLDPMEGSVGRNTGFAGAVPGIMRPRLMWEVKGIDA